MTVSESTDPVDVCLTTLGTPVVDTIITVTVMYGSAEEAGENGASMNSVIHFYTSCVFLFQISI